MESQITESQSMRNPFMEPLEGPEWQRLYRDALVEVDMGILQERLAAAEAAILLRLQAMSPTPTAFLNGTRSKMLWRIFVSSSGRV